MRALDNWGTFPSDTQGNGPRRPGAWADDTPQDEPTPESDGVNAAMDVDRTDAARVGGPKSASRMQAAGLLAPRVTLDDEAAVRPGGRIDPISVLDLSRIDASGRTDQG